MSGRCHLALGLVLLGAGCQREGVKVYDAPKEPAKRSFDAAPNAAGGMGASAAAENARPVVEWTLPTGWFDRKGDAMRIGSFAVTNQAGKSADISVIPLSGLAGGDLGNVNRWRGQVGLAPITAEDLPGLSENVPVGTLTGKLYDLAASSSNGAVRMLVAVARQDEASWFFKMLGDDALVASQKGNFQAFLKSVRFSVGVAPATPALPPGHPPTESALPAGHPPIGDTNAAPAVAPATSAAPLPARADLPTGWKEQTPRPMQSALFVIEDGGKTAEVSVSDLGGQGGGDLANVNRWRQQIGLEAIDQAGYDKLLTRVDVDGKKVAMVDMPNPTTQKRMIAVIVPRGDSTRFYKLLGQPELVGQQKDAFLKFVQASR